MHRINAIEGSFPASFAIGPAAVLSLGLFCLALAVPAPASDASDPGHAYDALAQPYDPLPDESPALLSQLYYTADEVPGIAELPPGARRSLLDAVTERHRNRLVNRAPEASPERIQRFMDRLAASELAQAFPDALRQACAQHGVLAGSCAPHKGYVRRTQVLEEMLAAQRLTLAGLEMELIGAVRPALRPR